MVPKGPTVCSRRLQLSSGAIKKTPVANFLVYLKVRSHCSRSRYVLTNIKRYVRSTVGWQLNDRVCECRNTKSADLWIRLVSFQGVWQPNETIMVTNMETHGSRISCPYQPTLNFLLQVMCPYTFGPLPGSFYNTDQTGSQSSHVMSHNSRRAGSMHCYTLCMDFICFIWVLLA